MSINFIFSCLQLGNSPLFFFLNGATSHSLGTTALDTDADFGKVPINLAHDGFGVREYPVELYVLHSVCAASQVRGIYYSLSVYPNYVKYMYM